VTRLLLPLLLRLPQGALSRLTGRLADLRIPRRFRGTVNRTFAALVGIRTEEAERPPRRYRSVGDFFVRRLRPGARDWSGPGPGSPVDGVVGQMGTIHEGLALQAKGLAYSVAELMDGVPWEGGRYLTIYLSPRHYHRIHWPVDGAVSQAVSVPGRLLPVNAAAVRSIPDLFPRNERLVVRMEADPGPVALVAVGAFNVGRISATFEPEWAEGATNRKGPRDPRRYDPPVAVERGGEAGAFHLGSTVILLFGPEWEHPFAPEVLPGEEIRLGAPLLDMYLRDESR
jgi:phosphatidylserine decarboxylase